MATTSSFLQINPSSTVTASTSTILLGVGSAATISARGRLVHPDPNLLPITFIRNPDESPQLDNDVLLRPITQTVRTLGTTKLVRNEEEIDDVIITLRWLGSAARSSMPTVQLRELYEYWVNKPDDDPVSPQYIQFQPLWKNAITYNVLFTDLSVGGRGTLNFHEVLADGGKFDGGIYDNPLDSLDDARTGLATKSVELSMLVISKV